jgi:hypothetical protein
VTTAPGHPPATTAEDRLVARFGDRVPPEAIRCALRDAHDALAASSRVTSYLGVLAERVAAARLEALAGVGVGDAGAHAEGAQAK